MNHSFVFPVLLFCTLACNSGEEFTDDDIRDICAEEWEDYLDDRSESDDREAGPPPAMGAQGPPPSGPGGGHGYGGPPGPPDGGSSGGENAATDAMDDAPDPAPAK